MNTEKPEVLQKGFTNNSKNFRKLKVFLTGYGPFMSCRNNPSEMLCNLFFSEAPKNKTVFDEKCEVVHKQIFEVSCEYVSKNVKDLHDLVDQASEINPSTMFLIIHCGVNMGAEKVYLERTSQNYINDYEGLNCRICSEQAECLISKLNLEEILTELQKQSLKCGISDDAGTYLCNYVFFLSNKKFLSHSNVYTLFLHIPSLDTMTLSESHNVLVEFVNQVKKHYII